MTPKLSDLSASLSDSLMDSDLQSVTVQMAESLADSPLEDSIARDIPVIGTIYGLAKVGFNVRDRLFLKKLLYFLSELSQVPIAERAEMVSMVDRSGKYRTKVGEKLLYILDKSDDHESARIIARLFKAFVSGILSYDEFLRACRAIQNIMAAEL
ncbi:MAG TPA: hypothetical protein VML01_03940, partial [Bryobacterales bacterium]|nr:hypothetical protein [Bryobacterales bacterium]